MINHFLLPTLNKSRGQTTVIVGLSGGVDSAVSALLLKEAGFQVTAIFMKNWEAYDDNQPCPAQTDLKDAELVAHHLNIPFQVVNFSKDYWQSVFSIFLEEYKAGRTPNPDILCNKEIKFKTFLDYAKKIGADFIATGHYAKIDYEKINLRKGDDLNKDQSYFLYALSQNQLAQSIFPIGHLQKTVVRAIAKSRGFPNHAKKDSTGICFIGEKKFKAFLNEFLPKKKGLIKNMDDEILGEHDGLFFYTIGQRQGIGIGGKKNMALLPWYVAKKDLKTNTLYVVQGEQDALYQTQLIASKVHWVNHPPNPNALLFAKTRYRQSDQVCNIELLKQNQYQVKFNKPQRAITPGQSIVFYQNDICLGGGIIEC